MVKYLTLWCACSILLAKGIVSLAELRKGVEDLDARGVSGNGARLVARAWVDSAFKSRLLEVGYWRQQQEKHQQGHWRHGAWGALHPNNLYRLAYSGPELSHQ